MRETRTAKALRIIGDRRIRAVREQSTRSRAVFAVVGDSRPLEPYTVTIERDGSLLVESCTCEGGQHHPVRSRCAHAEAARLVLAAIASPLSERSPR